MYRKNYTLLICGALAIVTFMVFLPVTHFGFVNFDDEDYVSAAPIIQQGPTLHGIAWVFTHIHAVNWHPLTSMSHMLDCQMFGLNAGSHHLINLLLHIANTLLLFLLLKRTTKAIWPSAFVAAVFALHPLHVESVAWISERKDVLSTFLWLLTMHAYARYTAAREKGAAATAQSRKYYIASLCFFALAALSKPMVVTLPFALLLFDWWPLRRASPDGAPAIQTWRPLVVEKIPFFALSLLLSVVTYLVQKAAGAVKTEAEYPFALRLSNVAVSYLRYLEKTFAPTNLNVLYDYPKSWPIGYVAAAVVVVVVISALTVSARKRKPYMLTGWLWFLGTLVPVIGLVQVGAQSIADRYMYVPMIGLLFIVAWGISDFVGPAQSGKKKLMIFGAVALLMGCVAVTHAQVQYWRDSETLFARAVAVSPENTVAQLMFADALQRQGKLEEAAAHCRSALETDPNLPEAHYNLAKIAAEQNHVADAMGEYITALKLDPDFWAAHNNLAVIYMERGDLDQALPHASDVVRLNPSYELGWRNLALLYLQLKQVDKALDAATRATKLAPRDGEAFSLVGNIFAIQGKLDAAIDHYHTALQLNNDLAEAHFNLGNCLAAKGQRDMAKNEYHEALRIRPDYDRARERLTRIQ